MKFIIQWFVYALAIGIVAYLLPGVTISGLANLLVLAIVLGVINTFVKPVLVFLTLPLSVFTLGLFVLVINALLILFASWLVPGFVVASFWSAILFSIILSIVSSFISRVNRD